jgi:hypothetical protein
VLANPRTAFSFCHSFAAPHIIPSGGPVAVEQKSVQELVDKEPFRPFRIVTASGKEYLVENPDLVIVMRSEIFYAFPKRNRWTLIPVSQITSIEDEVPAE